MQVKTAALLLFLIVYVATIGALSVLLGVGSVSSNVGVPLLSSVITLGLGGALALIEPGSHVTTTIPAPSTSTVTTTTATEAAPTTNGPAPALTPTAITGQATTPAMPGA